MTQIRNFATNTTPTGAEFGIAQTAAGVTEKLPLSEIANLSDNRGWSMTHDSQYTQPSPLTVSTGTRVKLTNNGSGSLTDVTQMPNGLAQSSFYNTSTNLVESAPNIGDALNYRITMQMTPSQANVIGTIEFQIEDVPVIVTGGTTITFPDTTERTIHLYTSTFVLQNLIDNDAGIYVSSAGGSIDLYDFKIFIERSYVGR